MISRVKQQLGGQICITLPRTPPEGALPLRGAHAPPRNSARTLSYTRPRLTSRFTRPRNDPPPPPSTRVIARHRLKVIPPRLPARDLSVGGLLFARLRPRSDTDDCLSRQGIGGGGGGESDYVLRPEIAAVRGVF